MSQSSRLPFPYTMGAEAAKSLAESKKTIALAAGRKSSSPHSAWAVQKSLQSSEAGDALLKAFNATPDELGEAAVALAKSSAKKRG